MIGVELTGAALRPAFYLPPLAVLALGFGVVSARRKRAEGAIGRHRGPSWRVRPAVFVPALVLCVGLLAVIALRCTLLPNRFYDSVTGFDLMGRVVAAEETVQVSLFEHTELARRGTYPPLTSLTFAAGYDAGLPDASPAALIWVLGFAVWMMGVARRTMGATSAMVLLAVVFTVPDAYSYFHLPLTNLPTAFFAAMAIVYLGLADRERSSRLLALSMLAAAAAVWTRGDAVAFVGGCTLAVWSRVAARTSWRLGILYPVPAAALLLGWSRYTTNVLGVDLSDRFSRSFVWDTERWAVLLDGAGQLLTNVGSMGVIAIAIGLVGVTWGRRHADGMAAAWLATGTSLVAYTLLYYQIDPNRQDPLVGLLESSYRRGITAFVFPLWWLAFSSPTGRWLRRTVGGWFSVWPRPTPST
jgi:hypothetical protein